MRMKCKIAVVTVFLMVFFLAGAVNVYAQFGIKTGLYNAGVLIPYGYYNANVDLAVGVQLKNATQGGSIYAYFFDVDGNRLSMATIPVVTGTRQYAVSLKTVDGNANPDVEGYVIILWDDDGTLTSSETNAFNVSATAILLDTGNEDAAYIPVLPLALMSDFTIPESGIVLTAFAASDITNLFNGSVLGGEGAPVTVEAPFTTDLSSTSKLIVWTVADADLQFTGSVQPLNGSAPTEVTIASKAKKLNIFNVPADVTGFPSGVLSGLIAINQTNSTNCVVFSLIRSDLFSASQTLLGTNVLGF